jgi:hypothetical protein
LKTFSEHTSIEGGIPEYYHPNLIEWLSDLMSLKYIKQTQNKEKNIEYSNFLKELYIYERNEIKTHYGVTDYKIAKQELRKQILNNQLYVNKKFLKKQGPCFESCMIELGFMLNKNLDCNSIGSLIYQTKDISDSVLQNIFFSIEGKHIELLSQNELCKNKISLFDLMFDRHFCFHTYYMSEEFKKFCKDNMSKYTLIFTEKYNISYSFSDTEKITDPIVKNNAKKLYANFSRNADKFVSKIEVGDLDNFHLNKLSLIWLCQTIKGDKKHSKTENIDLMDEVTNKYIYKGFVKFGKNKDSVRKIGDYCWSILLSENDDDLNFWIKTLPAAMDEYQLTIYLMHLIIENKKIDHFYICKNAVNRHVDVIPFSGSEEIDTKEFIMTQLKRMENNETPLGIFGKKIEIFSYFHKKYTYKITTDDEKPMISPKGVCDIFRKQCDNSKDREFCDALFPKFLRQGFGIKFEGRHWGFTHCINYPMLEKFNAVCNKFYVCKTNEMLVQINGKTFNMNIETKRNVKNRHITDTINLIRRSIMKEAIEEEFPYVKKVKKVKGETKIRASVGFLKKQDLVAAYERKRQTKYYVELEEKIKKIDEKYTLDVSKFFKKKDYVTALSSAVSLNKKPNLKLLDFIQIKPESSKATKMKFIKQCLDDTKLRLYWKEIRFNKKSGYYFINIIVKATCDPELREYYLKNYSQFLIDFDKRTKACDLIRKNWRNSYANRKFLKRSHEVGIEAGCLNEYKEVVFDETYIRCHDESGDMIEHNVKDIKTICYLLFKEEYENVLISSHIYYNIISDFVEEALEAYKVAKQKKEDEKKKQLALKQLNIKKGKRSEEYVKDFRNRAYASTNFISFNDWNDNGIVTYLDEVGENIRCCYAYDYKDLIEEAIKESYDVEKEYRQLRKFFRAIGNDAANYYITGLRNITYEEHLRILKEKKEKEIEDNLNRLKSIEVDVDSIINLVPSQVLDFYYQDFLLIASGEKDVFQLDITEEEAIELRNKYNDKCGCYEIAKDNKKVTIIANRVNSYSYKLLRDIVWKNCKSNLDAFKVEYNIEAAMMAKYGKETIGPKRKIRVRVVFKSKSK